MSKNYALVAVSSDQIQEEITISEPHCEAHLRIIFLLYIFGLRRDNLINKD
jgi:hypothetical protein